MRKVAVCIPLHAREVPIDFFMSFLAMFRKEQENMELQVIFGNSCYLEEARNDNIKKALEFKPDYILTLDADQIYPAGTITQLCDDIDKGHDIVGGLTNMRRDGQPLVFIYNPALKGMVRQTAKQLKGNGLFKCTAMGMGGVMFKPSVFERIKYPWFRSGYNDNASGYVGEDIFFFKTAYDMGLDVRCDTALKFPHLTMIGI